MLLFSRQGKLRLQKWYEPYPEKQRKKIVRDLVTTVLARKPKMCSFLEWRDHKIVYKRCGIHCSHRCLLAEPRNRMRVVVGWFECSQQVLKLPGSRQLGVGIFQTPLGNE